MACILAPSLLAADFLHLGDDIDLINQSDAHWLHIDIMDGLFVPNISFGQTLLPFIRERSEKPLDVHLMIEEPSRYISQFAELGANVLTIHYEAERHVHRVIHAIKEKGMKAGLAINPHTSVDLLDDILEDVDLVLLMSVNPGFGGQKFIYQTIPKIRKLKTKAIERNLSFHIEIDGGVGLHNAEAILDAGADVLVAGSSVFSSDDPKATIEKFLAICSSFHSQ